MRGGDAGAAGLRTVFQFLGTAFGDSCAGKRRIGIEGFQAQSLWLLGQEAGSLGESVRSGSRVRRRQGPPARDGGVWAQGPRGSLSSCGASSPGLQGTFHGCCGLHN